MASIGYKDVKWILDKSFFEYLINHRDEFCFNSILNGIFDAINDDDNDGEYNRDDYDFSDFKIWRDGFSWKPKNKFTDKWRTDFANYIRKISQVEWAKFNDYTKKVSYFLGWLIARPRGITTGSEHYHEVFGSTCSFLNQNICEKCFDFDTCNNQLNHYIIDIIGLLKYLLPGWEAPFEKFNYFERKEKTILLIPLPEKDFKVPDSNEERINVIEAIKNDDIEYFKQISEHIVNEKYENGKTILHYALYGGNVEIVKLLIQKGVNVNEKDDFGRTPLEYLLIYEHTEELFNLIVENSVELDFRNILGDTPIFESLYREQMEFAKYFIRKNNVIDELDKSYETPLHYASKQGYFEIVKLLLKHNLTCSEVRDYYGRDSHPNREFLSLIEHYKKYIDIEDTKQKTALYHATERGHFEIVKLLLENGASCKRNLICVASEHGYVDIVKLLIEHGVDVNDYSWTPLHSASEYGHIEIVKLLIENGADVNANYNDNMIAPLHCASKQGYFEIVKLLIENGAKVNIHDTYGETPLYKAQDNYRFDTVKLLLEYDVDVNIKTNKGITALHKAADYNDVKTAKLFIKKGADVNAIDYDGQTPLHYASYHGYFESVKLLIQHGADVNIRDKHRKTPLDLAREHKYTTIEKILMNDLFQQVGDDKLTEDYLDSFNFDNL